MVIKNIGVEGERQEKYLLSVKDPYNPNSPLYMNEYTMMQDMCDSIIVANNLSRSSQVTKKKGHLEIWDGEDRRHYLYFFKNKRLVDVTDSETQKETTSKFASTEDYSKSYVFQIKEDGSGFGIGRKKLAGKNYREIREMMVKEGFNLDNCPDKYLVKTYLAYHYDGTFWYVHDKTGFPISFIFSYMMHESIYADGRESRLWYNNKNVGGVKAKRGQTKTKAFDDCRDSKGRKIPCNFGQFDDHMEGLDNWISTLNNGRYEKCKKLYASPSSMCECMYKRGYHTSLTWRARALTMKQYWLYRKFFPEKKW